MDMIIYLAIYLGIGTVFASIFLGLVAAKVSKEKHHEYNNTFFPLVFFWPVILIMVITIKFAGEEKDGC